MALEQIKADAENVIEVSATGRLVFITIRDEHVNRAQHAALDRVAVADLVAALTVRARAAVTAGYLIGVHRMAKGERHT